MAVTWIREQRWDWSGSVTRKSECKVDIRLPGKRIQAPMAQGRSTKVISMIKWIRTSRLSKQNSLSLK